MNFVVGNLDRKKTRATANAKVYSLSAAPPMRDNFFCQEIGYDLPALLHSAALIKGVVGLFAMQGEKNEGMNCVPAIISIW